MTRLLIETQSHGGLCSQICIYPIPSRPCGRLPFFPSKSRSFPALHAVLDSPSFFYTLSNLVLRFCSIPIANRAKKDKVPPMIPLLSLTMNSILFFVPA